MLRTPLYSKPACSGLEQRHILNIPIISESRAVFNGLFSYQSGTVAMDTKCKIERRCMILIKCQSVSDSTLR